MCLLNADAVNVDIVVFVFAVVEVILLVSVRSHKCFVSVDFDVVKVLLSLLRIL